MKSRRPSKITDTRKPLHTGGVLRCCILSLDQHEQAGGASDEGTVLPCRYCKSALHVKDGVWRWKPDYVKPSVTP